MNITDEDKTVDMTVDEQFCKRMDKLIGKYITYGVPARDSKGHGSSIGFRVDTSILDLYAIVKRTLFDDWDTKKMDVRRNIFVVGLVVLKEIIDLNGMGNFDDIQRASKTLSMLNYLEKLERERELEIRIAEAENFKNNYDHGSYNYKKVVKLTTKIRKLQSEGKE